MAMDTWLKRLKRFFAPPVFEDAAKTRTAAFLNTLLIVLFVTLFIFTPVLLLSVEGPYSTDMLLVVALSLIVLVASLGLRLLLQRGHLSLIGWFFSLMIWGAITAWMWAGAGLTEDSSLFTYMVALIFAALAVGGGGIMLLTLLTALSVLGLHLTQVTGIFEFRGPPVTTPDLAFLLVTILLSGYLLYYAVNSLTEALQRATHHQQAQQEANRELERIRASLEELISERTRSLAQRSRYMQAAAEVSRSVNSLLDPHQLMDQVVAVLRERFGLYYVGLFLMDRKREWAVLQAGTGAAGEALLARGYRVRVGTGTVGWAIAHAQARVGSEGDGDVANPATPELPETRAEVAIPMRSRGQVLGALSVQAAEPDIFGPELISILQTMADQVAVGLDNAHLLQEAQEALEAARLAYGEVSREAWQEMLRERTNWGYRYNGVQVSPVSGSWRPAMRRAARERELVRLEGDGEAYLAIPLRVRDQIIGVLGCRKESAAATWSAEERHLLDALAGELAETLESAHLFEVTRRRAIEEQLVSEVTTQMRTTLDIDAILQTSVREFRQLFDLEEVEVRVGDLDGDNGREV
ncbi:MAG: GAF domain-containing protein [Anaerolineales bacterium]